MPSKIRGIVLASLLLTPVGVIKASLADTMGTLGMERTANANAGQDGLEMRTPIPNDGEIDQESVTSKTLELRLANGACPGVAQLVALANKCQFIGSGKSNVKAPIGSSRR